MITIARAVLVLLAAALVAIPETPALRLAGAMPLIFVLPGYALSLNFVPRSADVALRIAWTLALSVAVSVLLPIGLGAAGIVVTPLAWVTGLVAVTLVAEVAALRIRSTMPLRRPRPSVSLWTITALGVAGTVVMAGLYFSWTDAQRRASPTATQLWMVPGTTAGQLRIGVMRYGAEQGPLRLVIEEGSELQEYIVPTTADGAFETNWQVDAGSSVVRARLYQGDDTTPVREVFHREDDA